MSNIPNDLQYTRSHEWVRKIEAGQIEIGITDHAQEALGDLVFIEVPQTGRKVAAGAACAVVESVKAASDIYAPVGGSVTAGNPALAAEPELVNKEPYGAGWLLRLQPDGSAGAPPLLSAAEYAQFLAAETK